MPSFSALAERAQALQNLIGYIFNDPKRAMEALVAAGVYMPGLINRTDGHKQLALVGDAVLRMVLALDGYEARKGREFTNNILSTKAGNTYIAQAGRNLGLDKLVIVNPAQAGMVSDKVMASAVEAIIGAVFMDSDGSVESVRPVLTILGLGWPA
ncbi:hypothetical protein CBS63078_6702 [Aspergillus niger]|uniref:Major Facilitator Superfamily protein n=2 Tax=Aspergillus niger TaxID=5061 RepID=A0A3F3RQU7_ASPNG|nr:hypothetical protein CBS13152_5838 [Aspergillus niger]KAI2901035.1 hypothetical protein CBS63078_6702 [Aspergillus niger]KAI2965822.1 hypothetical protein CBS147323_5660 [Aspergillus niger]KAI3012844.1 hypothetical protein CBS147345_5933 [Aspergillus niger]KAI3029959.1 hypothetical protein CBS147347_3190 [Aspergillus niger]